MIEAVKCLDELFTSSSTVTKFTGLNPAASPANGALRSQVLIAAGVPVPWLQAGSVGARSPGKITLVLFGAAETESEMETVLLCYSVLLPIR